MHNLDITQGDEKAYNLHFTGGGSDIDITGSTVTITIKRGRNDLEPVLTRVTTVHTQPTAGKTTIILTESDTSIPQGVYYYDIQIHGGSVGRKTVIKGLLTITWQATEN